MANNIRIISLKDSPKYRQTLTDYVENNWKPVFKPFTEVLNEIFQGGKTFPNATLC